MNAQRHAPKMFLNYMVFITSILFSLNTFSASGDDKKILQPTPWIWEAIEHLHDASQEAALLQQTPQGKKLQIKANGMAIFKAPKGYWLKLLSKPMKKNRPPQLWYSPGNGLFVPAPLQAHDHQHKQKTWLFAPPLENDLTFMLKNSENQTQTWWLSRARPPSITPHRLFRDPIESPSNKMSWHYQTRQGKHLKLTDLKENQHFAINLQGPGQWQLESRLVLDGRQPWQRFVNISLLLNKKDWQNWRLHPNRDDSGTLDSNACELITSHPETLTISLPKGEHQLSFSAPHAMKVRLLKMNESPFLIESNSNNTHAQSLENELREKTRPWIEPEYNASLLNSFFSREVKPRPIQENHHESVSQIQNKHNTFKLIQQRYQAWRPLSTSNGSLFQQSAWLVDVKIRNNHKADKRFVLENTNTSQKKDTLLKLGPGTSALMHAPSEAPKHTIKLSLPIQKKDFDINLKAHNGHETQWLWRPGLMNINELDVASAENLLVLANSAPHQQAFATASGITTLTHDSFPISVSHNAQQGLWFSPFYQDTTTFSLNEESWLSALEQLGADQMLSLITQSPSLETVKSNQQTKKERTRLQPIKEQVWLDWQPLRLWLSANQQIWSTGLSTEQFEKNPLRHENPQTIISRLSDQADYPLLRQLLKSMAIKDPDSTRRQLALDWLFRHYQEEQDNANLSAYHSWQFQQNSKGHIQPLADWLVGQGQSKLALKLFKLTPPPNSHLPYQYVKLQQNWQHNQGPHSALLKTWQSIWNQDWQQTMDNIQALPSNHPWRIFSQQNPHNAASINWLETLQRMSLSKSVGPQNPVDWLNWIKKTPTTSLVNEATPEDTQTTQFHVPITLNPTHSYGSAQLYQAKRDLYYQMAQASSQSPVRYSVVGPIDMQVSIRLQHHHDAKQTSLDDWIEINNNGQTKWLPILNSQASKNIKMLSSKSKLVGNSHQLNLSLGPGFHQLSFQPKSHQALVSARVFSPALLRNLVKNIQSNPMPLNPHDLHDKKPHDSHSDLLANYLPARSILDNVDITYIQDCHKSNNTIFSNKTTSKIQWSNVVMASQWQAEHTLASGPFDSKKALLNKHNIENNFDILIGNNNENIDQLEQLLLSALWHWPNASLEQKSHWLALGNAAAYPHRQKTFIKNLLNKMNEQYSWQPEQIIIASAGQRRSNASDNSVYIAEREKLLWAGKPPIGERLFGHNQLAIITRFKRTTAVRVDLSLKNFPYRQSPGASVLITLNDKTLKTVSLTSQQAINLNIPSGQHKVGIRLIEPSQDHWLYVKAEARLKDKWQPLLKSKQKTYHVATHQQPLELYLDKPSWLRIDEFKQGKITHSFKHQNKAGPFILKPQSGQQQAMVRVLSLQANVDDTALLPFQFPPPPDAMQNHYLTERKLAWSMGQDNLFINAKPNGSRNYTDGVYLQYQSRQDLDSDSSEPLSETFMQAGWRHRRKLDCLSCYWRSDLFARKHTKDVIQIIGTHQWLQGAWSQSSWSWQLRQSLFIQNNEDASFKWLGSGTLKQRHHINQTLQHAHQIQLFARHLSEDSPNFITDNDIYSGYQNQHSWGVKLEETLSGRPWLDSGWRGHVRLASNELEHSLKAEYLQAGFTWYQYIKPAELSIRYRHRTYLKDEDRDSEAHKPLIGLNIKFWQTLQQGEIIQWQARFNEDLDQNELTFTLEVSWDFNRGRALTDFSPSESAFYGLRQFDISHENKGEQH